MPNIASWSDFAGRDAAIRDLATWTKVTPDTAGDRDGSVLCNFSSNPLFVKFVGSSDSAPTGSSSEDADSVISAGETVYFPLGSEVEIYGLHAAARTTGYALRETT